MIRKMTGAVYKLSEIVIGKMTVIVYKLPEIVIGKMTSCVQIVLKLLGKFCASCCLSPRMKMLVRVPMACLA